MTYPRFPLFVDLEGARAVVVGGGTVACRRIQVLLRFGAYVTVIAPDWREPVEGVRWERRPYAPGDLAGAALAVAAAGERAVNEAVGREARSAGIPVSVADDPAACTFYFPAVCLTEELTAGVVSRNGDHALTARAARAVRTTLEELT